MGNYRYFINLAYHGGRYHGWQSQRGAVTIQDTLSQALSTLLSGSVELVGAGRTDTGVHAEDFYAHFDSSLSDLAVNNKLLFNLNGFLPADIAVKKIIAVKEDAHARYSALSRTYEYRVARRKDPFHMDQTHYVYGPLNVEAMQRACKILLEYDDYTSFSKLHSDNQTSICHVYQAKWIEREGDLVFVINANRFLRNMVRAIVGTMLEIGRGKLEPEKLHDIFAQKDRSAAGTSVPGKGLHLMHIEYPEEIFR